MQEPGTASPKPAVRFKGVRKVFAKGKKSTTALDDVSFQVRPGTVTGLIGPDAAGKTTLMRLAAGLYLPDAGSITVLDMDVATDPLRVHASVGYMPQRFGLYEDLSVQENLDLYADLQGVPLTERPGRYEELTKMTGLGPFTRRLAGALSGGMKQKLGLACTLVHPPQFLLLDEPTVGVDPVSRRELWSIIYRLVQDRGVTVLLSTAYLDEAERCDEVILMHQGRILGHGPPTTFSERMKGRSFQVTAPSLNKRLLQDRLSTVHGVVDAIIQAGMVRLVTESPEPPDIEAVTQHTADLAVKPVPPRFEDRFIAILKKEMAQPDAPAPANQDMQAKITGGEDVIIVRDLTRRFGDFVAVKAISFTVRAGEVFGLLGANGAGKSTTFRMICGLLPSSGGEIHVAGVDLRHAAAKARARIGYMAQKFSLYADLSVLENLRFFSSAYGLYGSRQRERIAEVTEEFELGPYANSTSGELPLGYKQRLALAAALMHNPDILFLDEPTSGVDPLARREFWHRINRLSQRGVTVLVTTHFMEEAEYCDRLVIMDQGTILAEGTPEAMRERFRSSEHPEPTMEDAFIGLIEKGGAGEAQEAQP
jgi:ABC-2 type transport system ATP-binding protein